MTGQLTLGDRLRAAVAAREAGRLEEAERMCRQILEHEPSNLPATHLLAIVCARGGKVGEAIGLLRKVVAQEPQSIEALNQLASLLSAAGQGREAIELCGRVLKLDPDHAPSHYNLALAYLSERRVTDAIAALEQAVARDRNFADAYYRLGMAYQSVGRDQEAMAALARASTLAPAHTDAHTRLGHLMQVYGKRQEAIASFRRAAAVQPNSTASRLNLAQALAEEGKVSEAEEILRQAIALEPKAAPPHWLLGNVLSQRGRFAEAVESYQAAIALAPAHSASYLGIVSSKQVTAADRPLIDRMTALVGGGQLTRRDRTNLHYALGKAFDDLGDYAAAMRHFDEANRLEGQRLRSNGGGFNAARHAKTIDRAIATFTPEFFAQHRALGSDREAPILILGMMRSGTTLVEQIVSSHSEIAAGDEIPYWSEQGAALEQIMSASTADAELVRGLANDYAAQLALVSPLARRVTDKTPNNFIFLGLIHLAMPRARIIHCRRNPIDTCLSIYFTPYTASPAFAHDRANIAAFYADYLRLMAHWRTVLPADRFLEVDYEDLIAHRELVARRLIEFCGVQWQDACLRHEANTRVVRTSSAWQARQPLYATSVERWRRYEPWLGEFRRLLQEAR
jgi:tetratricopeptide (TPR) repeat protein